MSAHTTSLPVSAKQAPATRPTYPVPTTATFMHADLHQPRTGCQPTARPSSPVRRTCATFGAMCGIAGVLTTSRLVPEALAGAVEAIAHRGPDGSAVETFDAG